MQVTISETKQELGRRAAGYGAECIRHAIAERGEANIILATGASQFEMLSALLEEQDIDWSRVTAFHLDEYVGMDTTHPASFRKYLKERFVERLTTPLRAFHLILGESVDSASECRRLNEIITQYPIDVAFVGIGENGHLAFNDPPADFETDDPYIVVNLDEPCRRQQLGEGWFATLEEVPKQAISMSIRQVMKSRAIVCSVPDLRKAKAVKLTLKSEVSPFAPASILQLHPSAHIYLDPNSASLIDGQE